ncbi:unnamed protein product [Notodromas monacha]|uniref:Uncharacterized protein n=1 Tax=Notodromas monacha TaxID=399045 RepID=A0A7R9BZZ5_9CRUS|nr:unnamed protein product [Notodromas monacha]CAG0923618.1 unnamed protein product [Notodromas monacha]
MEKEVGEFIAETLFGQGASAGDSKSEEGEDSDKKEKKSKKKSKKSKKNKKKKKKSKKSLASTESDEKPIQKKYDITGPYTPVPTVEEDKPGFKRSKASKAVKSLKSVPQESPSSAKENEPEEDSASQTDPEAAVEVLSALGKSFEKGQLTEQELSDFIKGIDLEFDNPAILGEFAKRNSPSEDTPSLKLVNDENVQSDSCLDGIGSIMYSLFQLALCILFAVIIFQLLASVSCVDWKELFNMCSVNEYMNETMNPKPQPRPAPCFFDKLPTACDLINLPCKMFGCKGGGGISICDFLPSGGRVPKKSNKEDDECAGFMQNLCQNICTSPSQPADGGGRSGKVDGAPAGTTDDEEAFEDDDGFMFNTRQSRSVTDPNALYMSVRHQRGGHAGSPVRQQRKDPRDQQPYAGGRRAIYRNNTPLIDDYTDDQDDQDVDPEPDADYGTGGFTTPFVGRDDDGYEDSAASVDAYASTTAGIAMHGHVRSQRRTGSSDTLIRKWNENREYLNPPINVFMPSSTAQQVLVRQALMKGQALGVEEMSPEDLAILEQINAIDFHFNEPSFENVVEALPQQDSPDIEPSFYWTSPPKGLEVLPILPPDPPPGPFSSKSDIAAPNVAEMLNGCAMLEGCGGGSTSRRSSQSCQPGFDLCDYFPKEATQDGSDCDPMAINICDFTCKDGPAAQQTSQQQPRTQPQASAPYLSSQQQSNRQSEGGTGVEDEPEEIVDEFLRSKFMSRQSMEMTNQFYQQHPWNRPENPVRVRDDREQVAPSGKPSSNWAAPYPPGSTGNVVHFTAAAPEPPMMPRGNQSLPFPQPNYPNNFRALRNGPGTLDQRPASILRAPSQNQPQQFHQHPQAQQQQQHQQQQQFHHPTGPQFQQPMNPQQGYFHPQQQPMNPHGGYFNPQQQQQQQQPSAQLPPRGYYNPSQAPRHN